MKEILIYLKNEITGKLKNPQKSPFLIPGLLLFGILFCSGIFALLTAAVNHRAKDRTIDSGSPHLVISSQLELADAVYNTHNINDRLKRYNFKGAIKLKGFVNRFEFQPKSDKYDVVFTIDENMDVQINTGEDNTITYKRDGITVSTSSATNVKIKQNDSKSGTIVQIHSLTGKINVDILHSKGASLDISKGL
jgi:hypothetical protein